MRALVAAAALVLVGCSQPSANKERDTRRILLKGLGEQIFLPRYVEFEERAHEIEARASALCDDPTEETLGAARDVWWASRAPWKRNETVAFGPYVEPTFFGDAIDFWPCRPESILLVLDGTEPIDGSLLGAAAKGLPAIEYLLYEPDADVVAESAPGSRRCEYLGAMSVELAAEATAIREAWDPAGGDFLGELVEAGRDSETYDSVDMALGEVVNRLVYDIEAARNAKIGAPLGNRTAGVPQPYAAESHYSGRSLEDVRDNLRGVEEVCFGADVEDAQSLTRYLDGIGRGDIAPALREAFDESYAALDAIPGTLNEAVVSDPALVQEAVDRLGELQLLIQADLINAMGLMLTFTDADGD